MLDPDTVRLSAELAAADSVRWGVTTVFDHHASPAVVEGSLELVADAVERAGLSGVLCYEISDRSSHNEAMRGLDENLRFAARLYRVKKQRVEQALRRVLLPPAARRRLVDLRERRIE